jgi:hypothetical protein
VHIPRKVVLLLAATAALVFAVAASARGGDDGKHHEGKGKGNTIFSSSLAPSVPDDVAIHGIVPGGVPWVISRGSRVELKVDGELELRIRGLIIPGRGDAGPVTTVSASLLCGADTAPAATTGSVPLSSSGDARIEDQITVPATCLAPSVLVNPNGNAKAYIAVSGWKS